MEFANKKRIPLTICGFHSKFADSTYNSRIPQQLNLTIQVSYHWFVDSQTVLDSANTFADSANWPIFEAIMSGTMI